MNAPEVLPVGEWTQVGLSLPDGLTFGQWQQVGQRLLEIQHGIQWLIGDWLNYGERKWGETYTDAIAHTGYAIKTLRQMKWVASSVHSSVRTDKLSFEHHMRIAALPPAQQSELLTRAAEEGWSVKQLRENLPRPDAAPTAEPAGKRVCIPRSQRATQIAALAQEGHDARQISAELEIGLQQVRNIARKESITLPDVAIGKAHPLNPVRIFDATVMDLEACVIAFDVIGRRLDALSQDQIAHGIQSMESSLRTLRKHLNQLRKHSHG